MPGKDPRTIKRKNGDKQAPNKNKKPRIDTRVNRQFIDLLYKEAQDRKAKQDFDDNYPDDGDQFYTVMRQTDDVAREINANAKIALAPNNDSVEVDRKALVDMTTAGLDHCERMCNSIYRLADKAFNKATQNARILKNTSVRIVGVPKSSKEKSLEAIVREILTNGLKFTNNTVKRILDSRVDITRPAVSDSTRPFIILRCGSVDDKKMIMAAARQHLAAYRYSGTNAKVSINPDQTPEDYLHSRKAQTLCRILMKVGYAEDIKVTQNVLLVVGARNPVHYSRLLEHLPSKVDLIKKLDESEGGAGVEGEGLEPSCSTSADPQID